MVFVVSWIQEMKNFFCHLALADMKIGESLFCTNLVSQNKKNYILAEPFLPEFYSGCNGCSAQFLSFSRNHSFCCFMGSGNKEKISPFGTHWYENWWVPFLYQFGVPKQKTLNSGWAISTRFFHWLQWRLSPFFRFLLLGYQSGPQFLSFSRKHGFCGFMSSGNEEKKFCHSF